MKSLLLLATVTLASDSHAKGYLEVHLANKLSSPIGVAYTVQAPKKRRPPNWHSGISSIAPKADELIIKIPMKRGQLGNKAWNFIATLTVPGSTTPTILDIKIDKKLNPSVSLPGVQGYKPLNKLTRTDGGPVGKTVKGFPISFKVVSVDDQKLNLAVETPTGGTVELIKK